MPIKIPNELPAREILVNENIFVMDENRALQQDIRPPADRHPEFNANKNYHGDPIITVAGKYRAAGGTRPGTDGPP